MKLILISPSRQKDNEVANLIQMFENGLETFHLRKPRYSTKRLKEYIESIPSNFHNRIVLHSHHGLAFKYNIKGIHFTRTHLRRKFSTWWTIRRAQMRRMHFTYSISHSKLSSVYDPDPVAVDYAFLSPIFDSLTGKYQSGFFDEGIITALQKTGKKIIARGGIDKSRIEKVQQLGFYGMALYSCIWDAKDPVKAYIDVANRLRELGIKAE